MSSNCSQYNLSHYHWLPSSLCSPAVLLNKESVKQQVRQLQTRFRDLVISTYRILVYKRVDVDLRSFRFSLLALDVFQKHEHQHFINNHLMKIQPATTFDDLWAKLNNYWNFLNFDLLEHIVSIFGSEDLKQKMESYEHDLQSFRKATRVCDFIDCWPVRGQTPPKKELRKFVAKIKYDWDNCTLEDLDTLKGVITRKFFIPKFAFRLRKIKRGCISTTWLIPAPLVKALQEAVKTTSSDFFLEHEIETITIDRKVCHPSPSRKHVHYPKEQFTSPGVGEVQREKIPLHILPEKLHSFKPATSEEQPLPKETHRMRLAEEILSGQSMSMAPSEEVQFGIHPGDIQGEKSTPSFLSKLKQKFSIRSRMPSGTIPRIGYPSSTVPSSFDTPALELSLMPDPHTHLGGTIPRTGYPSSTVPSSLDTPTLEEMEELSLMPDPHTHLGGTIPRTGYPSSTVPSSLDTPTLEEMEELSLMPDPHTHLGGTIPRTGYRSSTSEYWFETSTQPEKDVRKGDWVNPPTPAERYVREKCVDEISQHVKLLPLVEQHLSEADVEADTSLPTKYKNYLSSTPAIRASLYTTFNAKMAAEVFTWSQHTESPPPTTMTELFTAFTLRTMVDHLSTHPVYHKQQLKVTTFSDLPTDVYKQFQDLCRMAYEGILNRQQLVFSVAHLPTGFSPLGLMQEVPQLYTEGRASSYHFIHLTLQEYLAAVHISQLPADEQTRLFQEHVNSGHFKMTMRFLAGRTKLANIPPDIMMDNELNCFHFLFEAKDISMTTRTLGSREMFVSSHYSWTPLDYYVTGHAISHSNCSWRLEFNHKSIDDSKFELLCQGCAAYERNGCRGHISRANFRGNGITTKSIPSFVNIPPHILQNMRQLCLDNNELDGSACDLLAKAVPSLSRLEHLWLAWNPIGSGGAMEVIKALCGSGVKWLYLYNTGIGEPDCEALCELLKSSHSLSKLDIEKNNLSSESVANIITGLSHNSSLKFLHISNSHFGMANVVSLASVLKDQCTLTHLMLRDCHISEQGASELAAALCKNSTLKHLNLGHNPIGVEGASSMSDMLQHNTSLEVLYLSDDSVGEEGVHQLINSLKYNQTLRKLVLPVKYKSVTSDYRTQWL